MKNGFRTMLALLMALVMMICMAACGGKDDAGASDTGGSDTQTEEQAAGEETDGEAADTEETADIVKTIEGVDTDIGSREPLQIETITLFSDGSVAIVPTEDLKKNEIKDDADAVYPFEESGKVEDVAVVDYGNGGYRTVIALMKDGSISVVNGRALVEDHIFAVMDNVGGRDNFVKIESVKGEDAYSIIATTEDGEEVVLDYSMNFDEPE